MKKTKIKKKHKKIILAEFLLLIVIIFLLTLFTPTKIGINQKQGSTFFEFKNAHAILIDDNPEFTSSKQINQKEIILEPGKYYWKAIGILGESKTGNFTIDSKIIVDMKTDNKTSYIKNKGNAPVNATSKDRHTGKITGKIIMKEGEKKKIETKENLSLVIEQK